MLINTSNRGNVGAQMRPSLRITPNICGSAVLTKLSCFVGRLHRHSVATILCLGGS